MTKKDMSVKPARLIFEDGSIFFGTTFSLSGDRYAEVVFNTAMTGYPEVLTDPSYSCLLYTSPSPRDA